MPSESRGLPFKCRKVEDSERRGPRECQQSICLGKSRKGGKSPCCGGDGDDERKGLNILKHMEHERIFSEKGAGLALAMSLSLFESRTE